MFFVIQFLLFLNIFLKNKLFLNTLYFLIFLFCSFRFAQGPDYFSYEFIFRASRPNILDEIFYPANFNENVEWLFRVMNSAVKAVNGNYRVFILVISFFLFLFVWKSGREFSKNQYLFIFLFFSLFFLTWPYSGIRQGLVLIIGGYFVCLFLKQKIGLIKFLIVVLILSNIHLSGIALTLFALIGRFQISKKYFLLFVLISLLPTPYVYPYTVSLINDTILAERILFYEVQEFKIDRKLVLRFCIFLCSCYIYIKLYSKLEKFEISLFQIVISSFIIYVYFKQVEILAAQISVYGFYFINFLLSNLLEVFENKKSKKLFLTIVIFLSLLWSFKDFHFMVKASSKNSMITKEIIYEKSYQFDF